MTIDRTATSQDPAIMSIHFASPQQSSSSDSEHLQTERVQTIDMTNRLNPDILQEFIRVTNAYPVEPTPEEKEEIRALEEQRVRSQRDRERSLEVRARLKREKELLEQARGDLGASQPT